MSPLFDIRLSSAGFLDISGNDMADELADRSVEAPLAKAKKGISVMTGVSSDILPGIQGHETTLSEVRPREDIILTYPIQDSLRLLVRAITGYCLIGAMAAG